MAQFIVQGGRKIQGRYKLAGNKNAALTMLAACILTDEPLVLRNVPAIDDVRAMLDILESLGVSVDTAGHTVTLCARGLRRAALREDLCRRVRSSILFAGPLCARLGRASLFPPGGDVIGRRRLDTHFHGLRALGISIGGDAPFRFKRNTLRGTHILLDEASVTATENILMAATLAPGTTTLFNAACEPHVQDLCVLLNTMGACITGIGTNHLTVQGVSKLHGARYRVQSDYIELGSFAAAALVTGGALRIEDVCAPHLPVITRVFEKLGVAWSLDGNSLSLPADQELRVKNDLGEAVPKIEDGTWPAFPSDLLSVAIVLATQATGAMLFFEKMFESRLYFVDRLIAMGARIVQCDPHRVLVVGPSNLQGIHLTSPDIRAGMALVLAAVCANGTSIIDNAESIDRGYEHLARKLKKLGADIVRKG